MSAEDPSTPLGFEYALMAKDPDVANLKQLLIWRYSTLGASGLDPRDLLTSALTGVAPNGAELSQYRDERTGTYFYTLSILPGRQLKFFITRKELDLVRRR